MYIRSPNRLSGCTSGQALGVASHLEGKQHRDECYLRTRHSLARRNRPRHDEDGRQLQDPTSRPNPKTYPHKKGPTVLESATKRAHSLMHSVCGIALVRFGQMRGHEHAARIASPIGTCIAAPWGLRCGSLRRFGGLTGRHRHSVLPSGEVCLAQIHAVAFAARAAVGRRKQVEPLPPASHVYHEEYHRKWK